MLVELYIDNSLLPCPIDTGSCSRYKGGYRIAVWAILTIPSKEPQ